jgi:hypothetical protein
MVYYDGQMGKTLEQEEAIGKVLFDSEEVAVFVERSDYAMRYHPGMASLVLVSYPERYIYLKGVDLARSKAKIFPIGCDPSIDENWQTNVAAINKGLPLVEEIPTDVLKAHLAHNPKLIEIEFTLKEVRVRGLELQKQHRQKQGILL